MIDYLVVVFSTLNLDPSECKMKRKRDGHFPNDWTVSDLYFTLLSDI